MEKVHDSDRTKNVTETTRSDADATGDLALGKSKNSASVGAGRKLRFVPDGDSHTLCTACKVEKLNAEFYTSCVNHRCKGCTKVASRKYEQEHKDKIRARILAWRKKDRAEKRDRRLSEGRPCACGVLVYGDKRLICDACLAVNRKLSYKRWESSPRGREMTSLKRKRLRASKTLEELEQIRARKREKLAQRTEVQKAAHSARNLAYCNKRYREDAIFKIRVLLRSRTLLALKGKVKTGSSVRDLGCTIVELMRYLESKFLPGMSWENHSREGWHVDHIRPLAAFDLTNRDEFLKAAHYTNLQPLWAFDNLSKGART